MANIQIQKTGAIADFYAEIHARFGSLKLI
jgi:hypothetical protein